MLIKTGVNASSSLQLASRFLSWSRLTAATFRFTGRKLKFWKAERASAFQLETLKLFGSDGDPDTQRSVLILDTRRGQKLLKTPTNTFSSRATKPAAGSNKARWPGRVRDQTTLGGNNQLPGNRQPNGNRQLWGVSRFSLLSTIISANQLTAVDIRSEKLPQNMTTSTNSNTFQSFSANSEVMDVK